MCDLPIFEPHIRLLEQWRDFTWQQYLLCLANENTSWESTYYDRAKGINYAIEVLKQQPPLPHDDRIKELSKYKYAQFPDDLNVPEMG